MGKSLFLLDILRRLFNDDPMPDGSSAQYQGSPFIWVDINRQLGEHYDRIKRWQAAGILPQEATTKIFPLRADKGDRLDLTSQKYQDKLLAMVDNLRPVWVIVDGLAFPSPAYFKEVAEISNFLNQLAAAYDMAITMTNLHLPGKLVDRGHFIMAMNYTQQGPASPVRTIKLLKPVVSTSGLLVIKLKPLMNDGVRLVYGM